MATDFFNPVYNAYNQALNSQEQKQQYGATKYNDATVVKTFDSYDDYEAWDTNGDYACSVIQSEAAKLATQQKVQHNQAIDTKLKQIPANQPNAKTWQLASRQTDVSQYGTDRYRLESIDVKHRMGDYLIGAWQEFQKLTVKNSNFWEWVSSQSNDEAKVKSWNPDLFSSTQGHPEYVAHYVKWFQQGVKYVTEEHKRDRYWVEVDGGFLKRKLKSGDPTREKFDTVELIKHVQAKHPMSLTAIWVLSPADKFYSHVVKIGRFHHSSLLAGTEIKAAGEWGVEAGKLKWVNGKSGHYRPELARFIEGLELLSKSGAAAGDAKVLLYKPGQTKVELEEPLATFLHNVQANAQFYTLRGLEVFA